MTLLVALAERNGDRLGQVILLTVAGMIYVSCYYSDFLVIPEPAGSGNMLNPRFNPGHSLADYAGRGNPAPQSCGGFSAAGGGTV
jgi:hypothetical protein